jgi:hypothetical protein
VGLNFAGSKCRCAIAPRVARQRMVFVCRRYCFEKSKDDQSVGVTSGAICERTMQGEPLVPWRSQRHVTLEVRSV